MLGKRYRVVRKLGEGGMGAVYEALDERMGLHVAVKRIAKVLGTNEAMQERFFREVAAMARVAHDNIVKVTDQGFDDEGRPYFVMELVQGEPLSRALATGIGMPIDRVVAIASQLLHGVHAIHEKNLLHRDLKPSNVMLAASSLGNVAVKIVDFGISKALDVDVQSVRIAATGVGMVLGTPGYVAPEMNSAARAAAHPRQDIYALGVILFEMLSGGSPWDAKSAHAVLQEQGLPMMGLRVSRVRADVPMWLDDLVARATVLSPADRFQSAEAMLQALLDGARRADGGAGSTGDVLALSTGQAVGAYEIVRPIGEGGMGVVYAAYDKNLDRHVALKFMRPEDEADLGTRERFKKDGRLAAQIEHPSVVRVHHTSEWGQHPYLVLELVAGATLREQWHRFEWPRLLDVVRQVAAALDACHAKGIVHRDVTPENILVDDTGRAKLVDFGIARDAASRLTRASAGEVLGRYGYKPLEQAVAPEAVSGAADQWALAAIVYEALTGLPPFVEPGDGPDDHETSYARLASGAPARAAAVANGSVGLPLSVALTRALDVEATRRFPSVAAFVDELARAGGAPKLAVAGEERPHATDRVEGPPVAPRPMRRGTWMLASVVMGLAIAGGGYYAYDRRGPAAGDSPGAGQQQPVPMPPAPEEAARSDGPPSPTAASPSASEAVKPPPPTMVAIRLEGEPRSATAIVDGARVKLPATVERPAGSRARVVVDAPGYHREEVEVSFDQAGVKRFDLRRATKHDRSSAVAAPTPQESLGTDDDILVKPSKVVK